MKTAGTIDSIKPSRQKQRPDLVSTSRVLYIAVIMPCYACSVLRCMDSDNLNCHPPPPILPLKFFLATNVPIIIIISMHLLSLNYCRPLLSLLPPAMNFSPKIITWTVMLSTVTSFLLRVLRTWKSPGILTKADEDPYGNRRQWIRSSMNYARLGKFHFKVRQSTDPN